MRKTAAHWFAEAGKVPGSAEWLPGLAAYMLAQGGDRRSSRFLFQQILQTAEHEYMKKNAAVAAGAARRPRLIDQLNSGARPLCAGHRHGAANGSRWSPPDGSAQCRSTRTACRWSSIVSRDAPGSTPRRHTSRCPTSRPAPSGAGRPSASTPQARRMSDLTFVAAGRAPRVCSLARSSTSASSACRWVGRCSGDVRIARTATGRSARGKISPSSAGSPSAGAAPGAERPSRCSTRSIELVDRR